MAPPPAPTELPDAQWCLDRIYSVEYPGSQAGKFALKDIFVEEADTKLDGTTYEHYQHFYDHIKRVLEDQMDKKSEVRDLYVAPWGLSWRSHYTAKHPEAGPLSEDVCSIAWFVSREDRRFKAWFMSGSFSGNLITS